MSEPALPTIRTPRLTLRPLDMTDADAIVAGVGNYDVSRWLSVVPYPYDREDAEYFLGKMIGGKKPVWAICDNDGFCGIIGLENELGFWIARPVWRRGYGFEAAKAIVDHWFADPAAGPLASGYFLGNERSGAVLHALGFESVGHHRRNARSLSQDIDAVRMRLSRARWAARRDFTATTPRLTLRPLSPRDADALTRVAIPEIARNLRNIPIGLSKADARAIIAASPFRGVPGFRLAIDMDGDLIGVVGFGGEPLHIGYFLHPDHWGQGLMSEALSAFLPELFQRFPVSRIAADHFEDNPASGRILRKLGFEQTGRDIAQSKGRLEPQPVITYAVRRETLKVPR